MTARVELRDVVRRNRLVEKADVAVDMKDEDACVDLLRRMAKRHDMKPGDVELTVYEKRQRRSYRV